MPKKLKDFEDNFWNSFNSSRCKTAMLALSIILVIGYIATILLQIPSEELKNIVIIVIGYWIGKTAKNKDKNMTFNEYQIVKLVKRVMDEEKK